MKKKDYIICIIIFGVMAILYLRFGIAIPCIIKTVTGLWCPGCGITRLCLALADGKIYQAFRYNPIIFVDVPLILITFIIKKIFKNKEEAKKLNNIIYIFLIIITIIFGVLRNTPYFSFLAPTQL